MRKAIRHARAGMSAACGATERPAAGAAMPCAVHRRSLFPSSQGGVTFIEVVIGLMFLAILSVSFVQLFQLGHNAILQAGRHSRDLYHLQGEVEQVLAAGGGEGAAALAIALPDGSVIEADGEVRTGTYLREGREVAITFFVPPPEAEEETAE